MTVVNFIIAIVALIIALLAYQRAGGMADVKRQIESLGSFREKTADLLAKVEKTIRHEETKEKKDESA
ncbi:MAG: hypothetical protein ABID54_11960 [Pseudomonadota bacterium]